MSIVHLSQSLLKSVSSSIQPQKTLCPSRQVLDLNKLVPEMLNFRYALTKRVIETSALLLKLSIKQGMK